MGLPLQRVMSSNIYAVGHDPQTSTLEVQFADKRTGDPASIYRYEGVPQSVFDGLLTAPSAGQFFAENVKGQFPTTKVS